MGIKMRRFQRWTVIITFQMLALPFFFANCSDVEFASLGSKSKLNIVNENLTDKQCVPGKRLAIWLDPDESGIIAQENYLGSIVSYSGNETVADNYNYYSFSAHPNIGPQPIGFHLNVFFYEGEDGLGFNFFANIDSNDESKGSSNNQVDIDIIVSGNDGADDVLISDDNHELNLVSRENNSDRAIYAGRFHYWYNTDGGAVGPLIGNDYKIQAKILNTGDLTNARFYSADGSSFLLHDTTSEITSFIIAFESYEACQ